MSSKIKGGIACVSILAVILFSCRKSDRDLDNNTYATYDNALAMKVFGSVIKQVHRVAMNDTFTNPGSQADYDACVDSVSISTNNGQYPATLSIFYNGSTSCDDGMLRSGVLQISADRNYLDSLAVYTITPVDFFSDSMLITGTITIKNKGRNTAGNMLFYIETKDALLTNDTLRIEWKAKHNWEWNAGISSSSVNDDGSLISGTSEGRSHKGNLFSTEVVSPLHTDFSCPWIDRGKLKITPNNLSIRTMDFGMGSCDDKTTVTINGKDIELVIY